MKTININDRVSVELTEAGARILNDYHSWLRSFSSDPQEQFGDSFRTNYKEGDPYVSSLWDIMYIFGKHCNMGMPIPFARNQIVFLEI